MARVNPKADQVGSLTRSDELLEARATFRTGEIPREQLAEIEDRRIIGASDFTGV